MNYLTYPTKVMNITQSYDDPFSHIANSNGTPNDYPIDDNCNTSVEAPVYCPCDEMIVKRIWGYNSSGTNTVWLESINPVETPTFSDYITILFMHPNDNSIAHLSEGMILKRGDVICKTGNDGNATGTHIHISASRGKFAPNGWVENNKGAWVITGNPIKPEEAFYLDPLFTAVLNDGGLNFTLLPVVPKPVERNTNVNQVEVIVDSLNCRIGPGINYKSLGFVDRGFYNFTETFTDDEYTWFMIEGNRWIANNGSYLHVLYKEEPPIIDEPGILKRIIKAIIDFIKKLFGK